VNSTSRNSLAVGIDIGGTNLRFALVDRAGSIICRSRSVSAIEEGRDAFCRRLMNGIEELRSAADERQATIVGIGAGVPGLIGRDGIIHSSVNMRPLDGFNLTTFLMQKVGVPAWCENDANVAALGEQRFGAGRFYSSCLVITIGTGLGSGLVLDGKLWTGSNGFAAEFGHVTVDPEGLPCPCGNRGCLEQYVSAGALVRIAQELLPQDILAAVGDRLDAEIIAGLALDGNAGALKAFESVGYWLGTGLASFANLLNPAAIIIGGGVAASLHLMMPALEKQIGRRCFDGIAKGLTVVKAELGDDAGLQGGGALVFDRLIGIENA